MAKGSHTTRGGWEPRTCTTCRQPIVISRQACWFHYDHTTNTGYAFHMSCPRRVTLNGGTR